MGAQDFQIALAQMKADPAFRKLSYKEQQIAVKTVLDKYIQQDQEFIALRPEDRVVAYQTALAKNVEQMSPTFAKTDVPGITPGDRIAAEKYYGTAVYGKGNIDLNRRLTITVLR